jgi:hypothetical protein
MGHLQTPLDRFFSWFSPRPIIAVCVVAAAVAFAIYGGPVALRWIVLTACAAIVLLVLIKIVAALIDLLRSFW